MSGCIFRSSASRLEVLLQILQALRPVRRLVRLLLPPGVLEPLQLRHVGPEAGAPRSLRLRFGVGAPVGLGVDSFSILFSHRSFQEPDPFPRGCGGFLVRRIPGKNGEVTPRIVGDVDPGFINFNLLKSPGKITYFQ